jgi:hypothetical protein
MGNFGGTEQGKSMPPSCHCLEGIGLCLATPPPHAWRYGQRMGAESR